MPSHAKVSATGAVDWLHLLPKPPLAFNRHNQIIPHEMPPAVPQNSSASHSTQLYMNQSNDEID
jgi:hypothetical protein